jgi:hypothetical protein
VLDQQDRRLTAQPVEEAGQRLRPFRAHAGHRFVEQEGPRPERQRDRDLELAALTMRKFGRRNAGAVLEADAFQRRHRRLGQRCIGASPA